jgi:hypothetical protein
MLRAVRRPRIAVAMTAAAAALAGGGLGGCGASGPTDEQQVAQVVNAFGRATAAKDYGALCSRILAPSLIRTVTDIGLPCEQALAKGFESVRSPHLAIGAISIDGDRATADVRTSAANQAPSQDTLRLERVDRAWRVASLAEGD